MSEKHRVTFDSNKNECFTVHLPQRKAKFEKKTNNLYVFRPTKYRGDESTVGNRAWIKRECHLTTIQENMKMFTKKEVENAKRARGLYQTSGTPLIADFKAIVRLNLIKNNPVTLEHVDLAERILGPDIGSLKGKITRKKPIPVIKDEVQVPPELTDEAKDIELCINTIAVLDDV